MPKPSGSTITLAAGQPQREASYLTVAVSYTAGVPSFQISAFGNTRLRAANDSIIFEEPQKQFVSIPDAELTAPMRAALVTIANRLDTL